MVHDIFIRAARWQWHIFRFPLLMQDASPFQRPKVKELISSHNERERERKKGVKELERRWWEREKRLKYQSTRFWERIWCQLDVLTTHSIFFYKKNCIIILYRSPNGQKSCHVGIGGELGSNLDSWKGHYNNQQSVSLILLKLEI